MDILLEPGKYVVAVSGGVDSVSLLSMLSKLSNIEIIVAHFDHGMREDSAADREFVQNLAASYGQAFEYAEGRLGKGASEAAAREARYEFLRGVKTKQGAAALVTAHHQDDLIETAIINLLRGTGRKGLTSLSSAQDIMRPLLDATKAELLAYAKTEKLAWREDSTNSDTSYLRNYVRHIIIPRLNGERKAKLKEIIRDQRAVNEELDNLLQEQVGTQKELPREWFANLPHSTSREVMATWLRTNNLRSFDRATIERAVVGAKTAKPGKKVALKDGILLEVRKSDLALRRAER